MFYWDVGTGKPFTDKHRPTAPCSAFAFSDDSKFILYEFIILTNEKELNAALKPLDFMPKWKTWFELWDVAKAKKTAVIGNPIEEIACPWRPPTRLKTIGISQNGAFRVRLSPGGQVVLFPHAKMEGISFLQSRSLSVIDTATNQELQRLKAPNQLLWDWLNPVVLFGNATALASVGSTADYPYKPRVFIWDISKAFDRTRWKTVKRSQQEWDTLWEKLGAADLAEVYPTFCALFATPPETCAFLKIRLQPTPPETTPTVNELLGWLGGLDDDKFAVREAAKRELERHCATSLLFLLQALQSPKLSLEQRLRVEAVVKSLKAAEVAAHVLRALRAVEVLEEMDTPQSRQLLKLIAQGDDHAWLTIEAKASLKRLGT